MSEQKGNNGHGGQSHGGNTDKKSSGDSLRSVHTTKTKNISGNTKGKI